MATQEIETGLKAMLDDALAAALGLMGADGIDLPEEFNDLHRVSTFAEVGMLTKDNGLVIRMADGHEYQIVIVRSK